MGFHGGDDDLLFFLGRQGKYTKKKKPLINDQKISPLFRSYNNSYSTSMTTRGPKINVYYKSYRKHYQDKVELELYRLTKRGNFD